MMSIAREIRFADVELRSVLAQYGITAVQMYEKRLAPRRMCLIM